MSREVHNGPTDETQARGTPYSGDPQGGTAVEAESLEKLPLDSWHRERGGRMVPFAGYEMPVQYEGIIAEHLWTRENAGLFDVSHMGQLLVHGQGVDVALEQLMPGDFQGAADMKPKYSLLLDEEGGIIDDLMATRRGSDFYIVVNGATKHGDIADMERRLPGEIVIDYMKEQALLALQGPRAAEVLEAIVAGVRELGFMQGGPFHWRGHNLWISRSGYTGEDGFEISVPAIAAAELADAITANDLVKPIGLGARDSLRLEAGLPLYGHDLDRSTTPVMAGLTFAINKRRRVEGRFPGAMRILAELENGPIEKRVGFEIEGRQPVREGALVLDDEGTEVGKITSGGFSPSLQRPIAMGYVATHLAEPGTALKLEQRSKLFDARVAPMPFVPHRYHRKGDKEKELAGGEPLTTNNRMELMAAIKGLEALKRPCRVQLHTDSIYVRDGITRWIHNWQRNGWRTSDKKPVKNAELWQELIDAAARHSIEWHWVKGHSGHPENDRVDALACAEADDQRRHHRL